MITSQSLYLSKKSSNSLSSSLEIDGKKVSVEMIEYIPDAVEATISAMREKSANSQTINIGNDLEEITISELARRILKKVKKIHD